MKILKYIRSKLSKTMSVETFAAVLWEAFRRMRKCNIETYGKFLGSVKEMNEEELMKLDWELSILDMFITTYCCRIYLVDEGVCDATLDKLHEFVYSDFMKISKMLAYTFQEESKIKYKAYFVALRSDNSFNGLCKSIGQNIYGREVHDATTLYALRIHIEANLRYITDITKNITKKYHLEIVHG